MELDFGRGKVICPSIVTGVECVRSNLYNCITKIRLYENMKVNKQNVFL